MSPYALREPIQLLFAICATAVDLLVCISLRARVSLASAFVSLESSRHNSASSHHLPSCRSSTSFAAFLGIFPAALIHAYCLHALSSRRQFLSTLTRAFTRLHRLRTAGPRDPHALSSPQFLSTLIRMLNRSHRLRFRVARILRHNSASSHHMPIVPLLSAVGHIPWSLHFSAEPCPYSLRLSPLPLRP